LRRYRNRREQLVAELLASPAHGSTAARVKAFVERIGGGKRDRSGIKKIGK
jgi:hypothetical protein